MESRYISLIPSLETLISRVLQFNGNIVIFLRDNMMKKLLLSVLAGLLVFGPVMTTTAAEPVSGEAIAAVGKLLNMKATSML